MAKIKDKDNSKKTILKVFKGKRRGKKYISSIGKFDTLKIYSVSQTFEIIDNISFAKFDESVDVSYNLGINPKQSDQTIRGATVLPSGLGKKVRIAVIAKGDHATEAEEAGADMVGGDDLIEKIQSGWFEFDKLIATPSMMSSVSKIGKVLGPKGLMPNPKLGTVTFDLKNEVANHKKGKVEYKNEKSGIVHVCIGKKSFGAQKLKENFCYMSGVIIKSKPSSSKGVYLKKVSVSTTMSPGINVDTNDVISSAT